MLPGDGVRAAKQAALPSMIRNFEQMAAGRVFLVSPQCISNIHVHDASVVVQSGGKLTTGDLKASGKEELREHRKMLGDQKAKKRAGAASLKGLTKKDLVEEAEIEYLSSLTGQNLKVPTIGFGKKTK